MFHYTYLIENELDGKKYIGVHSTENLSDGYIGSGRYLRRAIKEHGKENFKKIILEFHPDRETAFKHEIELIETTGAVESKEFYNVAPGGEGSFDYINNNPEFRKRCEDGIRKYFNSERFDSKVHGELTKQAMAKLPEETMEKIRNSASNAYHKKSDSEKKEWTGKIGKGLRSYWDNLTEEEREWERKRRTSPGNPPKPKNGYENHDFQKRWKPIYEKLIPHAVPLLLSDTPDSDIFKKLKEEHNVGFKLFRLVKYYEFLGIIKVEGTEKVKPEKVWKNKTICKTGDKYADYC